MLRISRLLPRAIAAVTVTGTCLLGLAVAPAGAAVAAAGTWHTVAIAAKGDDVQQGFADLDAVSCSGPGSCVAAGEDNDQQAVIATEADGIWSRAREIAAPDGYNGPAEISGVACVAATSCAAVGTYDDWNYPHHSFVLVESDGTWLAAQAVAPPEAHATATVLLSVGCSSAGNCVATGYVTAGGASRLLAVSEIGGVWQHAVVLRLPADAMAKDPYAALQSVSCVRSGTCVAVGQYRTRSGATVPVVASASRGHWKLRALAGLRGRWLNSVSCLSARSCVALGGYSVAGSFRDVSIVEADGRWGHEVTVRSGVLHGQNVYPLLSSMSCARSVCTAIGFSVGFRFGALALTYAHGRWGGLTQIAASGRGRFFAASAVYCRTPSACTAVGHHVSATDVLTLMAANRT
jgi:hypothetical protein